jgi:hypothetical protein
LTAAVIAGALLLLPLVALSVVVRHVSPIAPIARG